MICSIVGVLLHLALSWLFVIHMKLELFGTGLACTGTFGAIALILYLYTASQADLAETRIWPDRRAVSGLKDFISLGTPTTIMYCLD